MKESMEAVATWFSSEVASWFDESELAEIEEHARTLIEEDGETWSAFHHRGTIPIEFKLDSDGQTLYIF